MDNKPYLIFNLNASLYAIEAQCVQEIFSLPELTPIAEAPRDVIGVVNLRGDILPVMDLNLRLGYQQLEYSLTDSVIILEWEKIRVGIIVNQVNEVHNILSTEITTKISYGREMPTYGSNLVDAVAKIETTIVMLLNPESLLSYDSGERLGNNQIRSAQTISEQNRNAGENYYSKQQLFCPHATPEERAIFRERAENLMRSTDKQDFAGLIPLAVIGLNGEYFGLDLKAVREFTDIRKITPVPCCPPHIVGNMNLRGEILTLIDIRGLLNMPILGAENTSKVMVVRVDEMVAGVTVDEVFDVMYLQPSQVSPVPAAVHSINDEYIRGTAMYREKMMSLLELSKIFKKGELIVNEEV